MINLNKYYIIIHHVRTIIIMNFVFMFWLTKEYLNKL